MSAPKIGRAPVPHENPMRNPGMYRWDGQPARVPKAGECYLSGAIPAAYRAASDMVGKFFIAVPVHETVTPGNLRSDIATLAALARAVTAETPTHRLRTIATRARALADDADALAKHLDSESLRRLLDNSET